MKAFIWISTFFVFSFLNLILGYAAGFRVGYLLFYLIWFYCARAMCKAWDKHRIAKKAKKVGISPFEYIKGKIPAAILAACEENRRNHDSLNRKLKEFTKDGLITRAYADILLDEYMKSRISANASTSLAEPDKDRVNTNSTPPPVVATSNSSVEEAFDPGNALTSKEPLTALMESHAKDTMRFMEANRKAQPNHEDDSDFGLVPEKPIYTMAVDLVDGQREYLGKLRTADGEKISWKRLGCTSADGIHGLIDIYETFLPSGLPYETLFINMYGAKKSVAAPRGFIIDGVTPKPPNRSMPATIAEPVHTQKKTSSPKSSSKVGLWITVFLLTAALGVSLFFNYDQRLEIVSSQEQIKELQKTEENNNNYKRLLSAMGNVERDNYKSIEQLLDALPIGYEDTGKIRTQYSELKKYINAIEASTFTTRSCNELRTAYANLYNFNIKYHNWDVSGCLQYGVYFSHYKKLVFGREWSDGTYSLHWYEDNDGQRLVTNLPSLKKNTKSYFFTSEGYLNSLTFGYQNQNDPTDKFDAFKIVDVIYSNGEWSITVYCYSNDRIYTLK